jgi:glutathione S-transferase
VFRILGRRTSSNVQKVLWCLAEMGHAFEQEDYGGPFGKTQNPDYLRLNPNATVPTLIDGDLVLWESNTIVRYVCNKEQCSALYPPAVGQRALVECWMDWQLSNINDPFGKLYRGLIRERLAIQDVERERAECARLLTILDNALEGHAFVVSDTLTLADIVLGPTIYRWLALDIERATLANVQCWYERLTLRSAYREYVMVGLH